MAQSGNSQSSEKKGLNKRDRASVIAEAEAFLALQKQKKRPAVRYYWKNPITGLRITHTKCRPRKSRVISKDMSAAGKNPSV